MSASNPCSSPRSRHFASDNYAGICPEAWEAMARVNRDHCPSYGDDPYTTEAANLIRETFETECEVFFVFNGTAANSLSLAHLCQSYHSILCHQTAHIETDECGAPEFFSNGTKILTLEGDDGKIDPAAIDRAVRKRTDIHYPKPRVLSLTNATELGTVYSPDEVAERTSEARRLGLRVQMDGARFANAVASLNVPPRKITWEAGVDVLSFGGTKNGIGVGEAVVFFDRELAREFDYRCKQAGHLMSKMRFLSAPWVGILKGGHDAAWLRHARHANATAGLLESLVRKIPAAKILFPRQANSVFVELPPTVISKLHEKGWKFYTFIGQGGCRFMCAWDTTEADVQAFAADIAEAAGHPTITAAVSEPELAGAERSRA
jgi:threonine aldolase